MIDSIVYVPYEETPLIGTLLYLHRYGYSRDILDLFRDDDEAKESYVSGLLIWVIPLISVFLLWSIAFFVFKCLGPKTTGYLSGSPFRIRKLDDSIGCCKRTCYVRCIFVIASICFIASSVLFVTQGLTSLYNTADIIYDSANNLTNYALDLTDTLSDIGTNANNSLTLSNKLLPLLEDGREECLKDSSSFVNASGQSIIDTMKKTLSELGQSLPDNLNELHGTIQKLYDGVGSIVDIVKNIHSDDLTGGDWGLVYFILPLTFFPVVLNAGVFVAWMKQDVPWLRCVLSWLFLPLFYLELLVACIISAIGIIISIANADLCSSSGNGGGPDETISSILEESNVFDTNSAGFQVVKFYIGQCVGENPLDYLVDYFLEIIGASQNLVDFLKGIADLRKDGTIIAASEGENERMLRLLQSSSTDDVIQCTVPYLEQLSENVTSLQSNTVATLKGMKNVLNLFSCESIVPLYTLPVHEGICVNNIQAITWTFSTFAVMVFTGLIMITLRSSWQLAYIPKKFRKHMQSSGDNEPKYVWA